MARANVARRQGDDFQARLFWSYAAYLLDPQGRYERVTYEKGPKGLDDIVVEYSREAAPLDVDGVPVRSEHFQCKWHTTSGDFGFEDLVDPAFINASSRSFLQNVKAAQESMAPDGRGYRFNFTTNWAIRTGDTLQRIIRRQQNQLDLEKLFSGGPTSMYGKVRRCWQEHLDIDEGQLRLVAQVLTITERMEALEGLRERLDTLFAAVGMQRVPANESAYLYDDLAAKLLAQGRIEFDRESFREMCRVEGLLVDKRERTAAATTLGVKSFLHPIDPLEDRCGRVLDLVKYFDGRAIRDEAMWSECVVPELKEFLVSEAKSSERFRLSFDAHVSIAFAAGSVLNVKSGREVEIEQRGDGREYWTRHEHGNVRTEATLLCETEEVGKIGEDVAVAISLTHDVSGAVRRYVETSLDAQALVVCAVDGGPSQQAVKSGGHAWALAEQLVAFLRSLRVPGRRLHLFMAGPNAFAFFLGQNSQGLGPITVYEFEFESGPGGSYRPGVTVGG